MNINKLVLYYYKNKVFQKVNVCILKNFFKVFKNYLKSIYSYGIL